MGAGLDPQKDWSDDSTCPRCGGYALVSGNDDWPDMNYSCEAGCDVSPRRWPNYRPHVTRSPLAPRPVLPPTPEDPDGWE